MPNTQHSSEAVVIHAQMQDDGTLQLRIEDPDTLQMSHFAVVRPDAMGALSDTRVGEAFLQLCGVPLMARRQLARQA